MSDEKPTPSFRHLLADELLAIAERVEKAGVAEAKTLAAQYGERIKHLAERLKAVAPPEPASKPAPPQDGAPPAK